MTLPASIPYQDSVAEEELLVWRKTRTLWLRRSYQDSVAVSLEEDQDSVAEEELLVWRWTRTLWLRRSCESGGRPGLCGSVPSPTVGVLHSRSSPEPYLHPPSGSSTAGPLRSRTFTHRRGPPQQVLSRAVPSPTVGVLHSRSELRTFTHRRGPPQQVLSRAVPSPTVGVLHSRSSPEPYLHPPLGSSTAGLSSVPSPTVGVLHSRSELRTFTHRRGPPQQVRAPYLHPPSGSSTAGGRLDPRRRGPEAEAGRTRMDQEPKLETREMPHGIGPEGTSDAEGVGCGSHTWESWLTEESCWRRPGLCGEEELGLLRAARTPPTRTPRHELDQGTAGAVSLEEDQDSVAEEELLVWRKTRTLWLRRSRAVSLEEDQDSVAVSLEEDQDSVAEEEQSVTRPGIWTTDGEAIPLSRTPWQKRADGGALTPEIDHDSTSK
ncbi:unnamed protein product [Boreogadus saida]